VNCLIRPDIPISLGPSSVVLSCRRLLISLQFPEYFHVTDPDHFVISDSLISSQPDSLLIYYFPGIHQISHSCLPATPLNIKLWSDLHPFPMSAGCCRAASLLLSSFSILTGLIAGYFRARPLHWPFAKGLRYDYCPSFSLSPPFQKFDVTPPFPPRSL